MNTPKKFKSSPKRFHPKGLTILYEDYDIIVVDKVSGLLTASHSKEQTHTACCRLNDYVRKGNPKSRLQVFLVHRLDKETSGVLVCAKSEKAQRFLLDEWDHFKKKYVAVVHGSMPEKEGVITSCLAENSAMKMYSVAGPNKGQYAKTGYRVVRKSPAYNLLEVEPFTGRKDQIRVHLADQGCPVVGDKKYGDKAPGIKRMTLHAASITLQHPFSKEKMTFDSKVPPYFNYLMRNGPEPEKTPPAP
jgi:tRNA pseudouridine32 synthase/23S rRNA pseudouridine746 synthase/23S rRNA pseudouridine1911/1915/1917 synthase